MANCGKCARFARILLGKIELFRGRAPAAPPHVPEPVGGNGHG